MAAVDEHGELHPRRPAVLEQGVDRGPDRAAGVEDVVDEDDRLPLERDVEGGAAHDGLQVPRRVAVPDEHVVAVEGDVERADRRLDAAALGHEPAQALGERHAARVDADEHERARVVVSLDQLVCEARQRAGDRVGVEQASSPPGRAGSSVVMPLLSGLAGPG